jgi:hypothetical protein
MFVMILGALSFGNTKPQDRDRSAFSEERRAR